MDAQPDRQKLREVASAVVWSIVALVELRRQNHNRRDDRAVYRVEDAAIEAFVELLRGFYAIVRR